MKVNLNENYYCSSLNFFFHISSTLFFQIAKFHTYNFWVAAADDVIEVEVKVGEFLLFQS